MYVQEVKNAIIWDKKIVTTKTIGTSQGATCLDPNKEGCLMCQSTLSVKVFQLFKQ